MSTAVGGIEADQKALKMRAARKQREARLRFWRVFSLSSFFVVVLGANLYIGAVVMIGKFGNPFVVSKAPTNSTVQVKRPLLDRTFCRFTVFDNATSHAIEEKIVLCEKPATQLKIKAQTQFSWGGR